LPQGQISSGIYLLIFIRDDLRPSGTHSNIASAVAQSRTSIPDVLAKLEQFYGPQEPSFPTDPYEFLVWWHCGYPASDAACEKGWKNLNQLVGIEPQRLLAVKPAQLAAALRPGGMVPELRAERIKEIARRVQDEFGEDLRAALSLPLAKARKILKSFPALPTQVLIGFSCSQELRRWRRSLRTACTC
jgi:hypothetical protein